MRIRVSDAMIRWCCAAADHHVLSVSRRVCDARLLLCGWLCLPCLRPASVAGPGQWRRDVQCAHLSLAQAVRAPVLALLADLIASASFAATGCVPSVSCGHAEFSRPLRWARTCTPALRPGPRLAAIPLVLDGRHRGRSGGPASKGRPPVTSPDVRFVCFRPGACYSCCAVCVACGCTDRALEAHSDCPAVSASRWLVRPHARAQGEARVRALLHAWHVWWCPGCVRKLTNHHGQEA